MKKTYVFIALTLGLMASPMSEEKALSLFTEIKQKEYNWVISQWEKEMTVKTKSRSSSRKSVWGTRNSQEALIYKQMPDPLREIPRKKPTTNSPVDPITVPDI